MFARVVIPCLLLSLLACCVAYDLNLVTIPYPLEYREATDLYRGLLLQDFRNPYSLQYLPYSHSQYGFVWAAVEGLITRIFGLGFVAPRLVNVLLLLGLGFYFYRMSGGGQAGSDGQARSLRFALLLFFSLSVLSSVSNIAAMPNMFGFACFTVAVTLPGWRDFDRRSLLLSLALSWLAFFAKPYFGVAPLYVGVHLLLSRRWRDLAFYVPAGLLLLAAVAATAWGISNYYETSIALASALTDWQWPHLLKQLNYGREAYCCLILQVAWLQFRARLNDSYFLSSLLISLILCGLLAGHVGQYMLYIPHLMLPVVMYYLMRHVDEVPDNRRVLVTLFVIINAFWVLKYQNHHNSSRHDVVAGFARTEAMVGHSNAVLYNAPMSYLAIRKGEVPNEQGQVEFLAKARGPAHEAYVQAQAEIQRNVAAARYDYIITDPIETYPVQPGNAYALVAQVPFREVGLAFDLSVYERRDLIRP